MQRSSTARSASADSVPALRAARASASSRGRSRLPTWSARNGGRLRGPTRSFAALRRGHGINLLSTPAHLLPPDALGVKTGRARHGPPRARATITRRPRPPGRHTDATRMIAQPPDRRTGRIQPPPRARRGAGRSAAGRLLRLLRGDAPRASAPTPTGCSPAACPGGSRPTSSTRTFPQFRDLLVAVIDAREPEEADATAAALADALAEGSRAFQLGAPTRRVALPAQGGAAVPRHEAADRPDGPHHRRAAVPRPAGRRSRPRAACSPRCRCSAWASPRATSISAPISPRSRRSTRRWRTRCRVIRGRCRGRRCWAAAS